MLDVTFDCSMVLDWSATKLRLGNWIIRVSSAQKRRNARSHTHALHTVGLNYAHLTLRRRPAVTRRDSLLTYTSGPSPILPLSKSSSNFRSASAFLPKSEADPLALELSFFPPSTVPPTCGTCCT